MLRRLGLALSLFACASPTPAHDAFLLDARRPTPGPRLELVEAPSAGDRGGKRYRLKVAPGLPKGVVFGLFTRPFDHGFHELESGFQLDDSGVLAQPAGAGRRRLDEITLGPGPYPAGAVWEA